MAAGTVIGSLRVILGADTAAFETALANANKQLGGFAKGATAFGNAAAVAIGAAAAAITASIGKTLKEADNLNKASQKFGVPVEQLSALKYAADLADVSFESLGKGLGKLSKAMLESAANPAGEAAKNFAALGISVKDSAGNLKTTEAVFGDIAAKFSTMEDGAAKTAMAIRIFGKAGADLIPLLNQGKTGIAAMTEEAKKLGIIISTDTAAKAEEFNDTLKKIGLAFSAIGIHLAAELLPAFQKFADMMLGAVREGTALQDFSKALAEALVGLGYQLQAVSIMFENFGRIVGSVWVFLKSLTGTAGDITAALAGMDRAIAQNTERWKEFSRSMLSLGTAGAFDSLDNLPAQLDRVARGMGGVNTATLAAKNALQSFLESQQKSIAGHEAEALAIGMGVGAKEKLKLQLEAVQIAMTNGIPITAAYRAQIVALSNDAANAAIRLAGAQMAQDALSPWELYQQKLTDVNAVLAKHPEYAEAAKVASMKAAAAMVEAYGNAAAGAMGGFAEFFKTFGKGNKEMFLIGKAFSISQAIINTLVGATKALATLPPPWGEIAAAGVIASGMATVAKIVAEKPPAMATGGAMRIPGSGGIDSRMVQFMGSPGETVRVDQNKYGESGAARTITLEGVRAKDYYRGDVLRDFVDNLNEAIGDGLKIKLA